jgi:hypothetical protein
VSRVVRCHERPSSHRLGACTACEQERVQQGLCALPARTWDRCEGEEQSRERGRRGRAVGVWYAGHGVTGYPAGRSARLCASMAWASVWESRGKVRGREPQEGARVASPRVSLPEYKLRLIKQHSTSKSAVISFVARSASYASWTTRLVAGRPFAAPARPGADNRRRVDGSPPPARREATASSACRRTACSAAPA